MQHVARPVTPLTPGLPAFYFGGDYNPEQWTPALGYEGETVWREDIRLMRLAGVNVATVGVFSWVSLQPNELTFTFGWLDRVLDLLHENGIRTCLATATAAQPAWLSAAYPDALPVDEHGHRHRQGQRQNYCPTSQDFRRLTGGMARAMAERYKDHPALLLWHISNEYGPYCYCERCADRFRQWLQGRYGCLGEINRRWTTAFWSHTYTAWEQIIPPGPLADQSIQGQLLDYRRFMSDMLLECYLIEVEILRAITPEVPITTNLMGTYKPLDYFAWAPHLDVISWDSYPQLAEHPSEAAFRHDLMRGLKGGQPWLLMEQTPTQVQWAPHNPLKRPGVMRLQSYQAIAHGSDAVMYFQWRQSRGSAEKYHGAVVAHVGHEHTRAFREVAALGAELARLDTGILGTRVPARVALVFSWPNWWNVEFTPGPSSSIRYVDEVQRYYRALWERSIGVDVVSPDMPLDGYDLVVAPLLNMVGAEQAAAIEQYVEGGGAFLTTYFSGMVDENDRAWLDGYPGPLRRTLGIWVEEFDPLLPGMSNRVVVPTGAPFAAGPYACDLWCEVVHLEGAMALASFGEDFYAGAPAITEHRLGRGRGLYVATRPEQALVGELVGYLLADLGIAAPLQAQPSVEVLQRAGDGRTYTFVLNHGATEATVELSGAMWDLIGGKVHTGSLDVAAHDVAILVAVPPA